MPYVLLSSPSRNWVVRPEPAEQTFGVYLYEACELVLRAVDVDTGRGIPGVKFGLENEGYGNDYTRIWFLNYTEMVSIIRDSADYPMPPQ